MREGLGLVVPLVCAGCGAWDAVLCGACATLLSGRPFRCESTAPRLDVPDGALPVWATAAYAGPVRDAVVAWKDRGRVDVEPWLRAAVRAAARAAAPVLTAAIGDAPLAVVPVPSRPGARIRRGGDRTGTLALAVAAGLRTAGLRATVDGSLAFRGAVRDQVGLGARARGRNLRAAIRVTRTAPPDGAPGRRWTGPATRGEGWVVVVDDVLTTGATLAAATHALASAGARPIAGIVLAATPPPTPRQDHRPLSQGPDPG